MNRRATGPAKKAAPERVRPRDDRLEIFARISGGWFWETDAEHRFTYMSDSVEAITGIPPEWHYGKTRDEIGAPDTVDPNAWHEHLDTLKRHEPFGNFEFLREGPNGSQWMRTSGQPLFDEAGRFIGYRGIATDVSELKRSQAKAVEQANTIETAMLAIPDGMLILDEDLEFVSWNDRVFEILGLDRDLIITAESPAKTFRQMMATRGEYGPGDPRILIAEHEQALRRNEPSIMERQLSTGRWVEIRNYPIDSGGYVAIIRDFTERHEIERVKSEFISTVSHELRTPLTAMLGSTGLLVSGALGELPEPATEMLALTHNNGERLLTLINDLLDFEKIGSGRMQYRMGPIDVGALLRGSVEANRAYAERHETTLDIASEPLAAEVYGDESRLAQVLANLLSNAAKFSPRGETVEIRCIMVEDGVRISVADRGPGIPEAYRAYVFEKFTQADSSDTRRTGGTGLGLAISKAIVEHHGGRIWFETETGAGSTFHVDLPLAPEDRR